jgi:transcriptional regulator with XRE-family HTH domain
MTWTGAKLRVAREAASVSLTQMARLTHFSKSHLSNVESGRGSVTPDVVLAYAQVLGDDMDRRGLLTGLAAGIVAPIAASELIHHGFSAALDGRRAEDE